MSLPTPEYLEALGKSLAQQEQIDQPASVRSSSEHVISPERVEELKLALTEIVSCTIPLSTDVRSRIGIPGGKTSFLFDFDSTDYETHKYIFEPRMSLGYDATDANNWVLYVGFDTEDPWVQNLRNHKKESVSLDDFYDKLVRGLHSDHMEHFPDLYNPDFLPLPVSFESIHTREGNHVYWMKKPLTKIDFYSYPDPLLGPVIRVMSHFLNTGRYHVSQGLYDQENWHVIDVTRNVLKGMHQGDEE